LNVQRLKSAQLSILLFYRILYFVVFTYAYACICFAYADESFYLLVSLRVTNRQQLQSRDLAKFLPVGKNQQAKPVSLRSKQHAKAEIATTK
jgi:hypothetical protein